MDVSFIPGIKWFQGVLIGDHEVGKTSLLSSYGTREPLNPLLPGITEPIQIHVEHLYKLYLLSIHDTEGVHPPPDSLSTSGSDSPPASIGLPISSSQWSVQVVRTSDNIVTARRIEYGLANVILICFSLADRWSFEHVAEVWHKEIHQLCPHIPFIVIGTKLDLRRPDPYVLPHGVHTGTLRLTPTSLHSTTPQPQVRPHPFSRFSFSRPTFARSNTLSSHSSEEKGKRKMKASSEIDRYSGASQIIPPLGSHRQRPSTTKHISWYGKKCKNSISPTSSPKVHHASLATDEHPPNSPSLPSASGSPTCPSLQPARLAPPKPSTSKRSSLNVLGSNGVGRSLYTLNPFKRTCVASISNPAAMALTPRLPALCSGGPTGSPSPATQPGPSRSRPALIHRHTTDTVMTATISGGSGDGNSVAGSGVTLRLARLAIGGGTTASERERFSQSHMRSSHPIPPRMSPIASDSSIGVPITSPIPTSEPDAFGANPPTPSPNRNAKIVPIQLPSMPSPASGSSSPGSPEVALGTIPRREGDGDGLRSRGHTPRRSKRNLPISYSEAHALAREIGASAYIECSALTLVNVVAVFEEAVKVAVERKTASSSTLQRNRRASLSISDQKDCVVG